MTTAYPLSWPVGVPRTEPQRRETGRLKASLGAALENVQTSLRLFGGDSGKPVSSIVISSNCSLGQSQPSDPGIAIWFHWDGRQVCIPIDRYATPAANLQAIHHVIEARRVEARHGTLTMVRQAFAGFAALPPPRHWSEILGVAHDADRGTIEAAYRSKAKAAHPDAGGTNAAMAELNAARETALAGAA